MFRHILRGYFGAVLAGGLVVGAATAPVMAQPAVHAAVTHAVTITAGHDARRCTRDITVARDVGESIASWTSKCTYSVQVFADWFGEERWGAKVHDGSASTVTEPTSLTLARADCNGYNTFNSSGTETNHVITFGSGC